MGDIACLFKGQCALRLVMLEADVNESLERHLSAMLRDVPRFLDALTPIHDGPVIFQRHLRETQFRERQGSD